MGCIMIKKNRFSSLVSPSTDEISKIHESIQFKLVIHGRLRQKSLFTIKEATSSEEISSMKYGSSESIIKT